MQGEPFKYFAYGAAAAEVEVDGFTGIYRLRRADIVHDVGDSLSPLIDVGQIEGGFVQGVGWLTLEELVWDETGGPHRGRLNTQAASSYQMPSFPDVPPDVHRHAPREAGAKMVVSWEYSWGRVGGGNLEATAVARARELIESGAGEPEIRELQLNPHARTEHGRQCCGGVVKLLLEPLAVRPLGALFGVGHRGYEPGPILVRPPIQPLLVDSPAQQ